MNQAQHRGSAALRQICPTSRVQICRSAALPRSEEHTSELQSRLHLVSRLLLEKKNRSLHGDASSTSSWRRVRRSSSPAPPGRSQASSRKLSSLVILRRGSYSPWAIQRSSR